MDYKALNKHLEEHGVSKSFLAEKLNLTKQAYYKREKNNTEWTCTEARIAIDALRLDMEEVERIFFA